MERSLLDRRTRAADKHDAALQRDPARATPAFAAELTGVVSELEDIARSAGAGADPIELAKTYRWLGDALFDLARGMDQSALERGAAAYARAERLLLSEDAPLELGKLSFNYGNTLRGLSNGDDVALLEAAEMRYENAKRIFRTDAPQLHSQVEQALATLEPQLRLAREKSRLSKGGQRLQQVLEAVRNGNGVDRNALEAELDNQRQQLNQIAKRIQPTLAEGLEQLRSQLAAHPERLSSSSSGLTEIEALKAQLDGLLEEPAAEPPRDAAPQDMQSMMLALIHQRYQQQLGAGQIRPERKAILDQVFAELRTLLVPRAELSVDEMFQRDARLRELVTKLVELLSNPSDGATLAPGSRREQLVRHLDRARSFLVSQQTMRHKPERDAARGLALFAEVASASQTCRSLPDDAAAALFERDVLRRVGRAVRAYALRRHLTLIKPVWSAGEVQPSTEVVYFSGGYAQHARLAGICQVRGLKLLASSEDGVEPGESRFRQLRTANVAVFDLTGSAEEQAGVCYELGIARTLGTQIIVLVEPRARLPFDIEIDPVASDEDLGLALDRAMYEPSAVETGDSIAGFAAEVERHFGGSAEPSASYVLRSMVDDASDPSRVAELFDHLSGLVRKPRYAMVRSAWAAPPRNPESRRCFHVMPFGPDWSDHVRDVVRAACGSGTTYVRGDLTTEDRIIHSIWNELCTASHVVVDLTGLNRNVLVELGMAHALGRPTLLLVQASDGDVGSRLIPALSKFRVQRYGAAEAGALKTAVADFLLRAQGT